MEFDAAGVKERCNGMLSAKVYDHIYQTALNAPYGDIVEVGAAHGAGTVSLALGLQHSGREGNVHSFEKAVGGSRARYGGFEENVRILRANLSHFGVSDLVELHLGTPSQLHGELPSDLTIGLLMLDADGRPERDFKLFFNQVVVGGSIIIDDVEDVISLRKQGEDGALFLDQKHRISHLLVKKFTDKRIIRKSRMVSNTWFGTKRSYYDLSDAEIISVYAKLISGNIPRDRLP